MCWLAGKWSLHTGLLSATTLPLCLARSSPRVAMYKLIMRGRVLPKLGDEANFPGGGQTNGKRIGRLPFLSLAVPLLFLRSVLNSYRYLPPNSFPPWWLQRRAHLSPGASCVSSYCRRPLHSHALFSRFGARHKLCCAFCLSHVSVTAISPSMSPPLPSPSAHSSCLSHPSPSPSFPLALPSAPRLTTSSSGSPCRRACMRRARR